MSPDPRILDMARPGARRQQDNVDADIVARRGRTVAFVEVKWRATGEELALAIDDYRLRRGAAAAEVAAHRYARPGETIRIDVLLLAPGRWPRHIVNAWQP